MDRALSNFFMKSKPSSIVFESVNACSDLDKAWAKSFINAVLRSALRARMQGECYADPTFSHPVWWFEKLRQQWPEQYKTILEADQQHPPMFLRVNTNKITRSDYVKSLASAGIACRIIDDLEAALVLEKPVSTEQLPGFLEGHVSVQDLSAQRCAPLLELQREMKVLDACAAPGGKSGHLYELEPTLRLTACDSDLNRCSTLKKNLERLGCKASVMQQDCSIDSPFPEQVFDRILWTPLLREWCCSTPSRY